MYHMFVHNFGCLAHKLLKWNNMFLCFFLQHSYSVWSIFTKPNCPFGIYLNNRYLHTHMVYFQLYCCHFIYTNRYILWQDILTSVFFFWFFSTHVLTTLYCHFSVWNMSLYYRIIKKNKLYLKLILFSTCNSVVKFMQF